MHRILLIFGVIAPLCLSVLPASSAAQDDGPARKLVNSQGCKACHTLEGDGGTAAGSFEAMRAKLSRSEVRLQLDNPAHQHGKGTIPDFSHLAQEELDALVNFIQPGP
jgi:mono/diheme cytochrome c family protein